MSSPSRLALQTQLPASPEHNNTRDLPHFFMKQQQQQQFSSSATTPTRTLFENAFAASPLESRFQSLASYEKFQPKALACCTTLEGNALGAVAGPHGVALFSMEEMHKPVMMLNRALPAPVSLAFSAVPQNPLPQSNLLLASAQGNGVLVWDVSGLRLSPLWGRLGMESRASIVSLAWYPGPVVTAATATALAAWDLRSHPSRPSLRFGIRKGDAIAPYVQTAPGLEPHECAVLDARGTVRIYDLRVTDRQSAGGVLYSFSALSYAGIGLATMDSGWLTWGLDEVGGDVIVKVWSQEEDISHTSRRLLGTIAQPHLACARVCPKPAESSFVTISFEENTAPPAQWNATMWKTTSRGLESTLSFLGGAELKQKQKHFETTQGTLCAAELTVHRNKDDATLLLCTLTNKGFLASYTIPEAIPFPKKESNISVLPVSPNRRQFPDSSRLFPPEGEGISGDAARLWQRTAFEGSLDRDFRVETGERDLATNQAIDHNVFDVEASSLLPASAITVGTVGEGTASAAKGEEKAEAIRFEMVELMKKIDTDRIPCPRMCGVTFGPGIGGLSVFHNGDIRKVWSWWENKKSATCSGVSGTVGHATVNNISINDRDEENLTMTIKMGSAFPRSLMDLHEMTAAARDAQWGGTEDGASSTIAHLEGVSFFEDDSASSSDSGDENNDDFISNEAKDSKDLYTQYFGDYQQPTLSLFEEGVKLEKEDDVVDGALQDRTPSDVLAPFVKITFEYDPLVLNRQSVVLARDWQLGYISAEKKSGDSQSPSLGWPLRHHSQQGHPNYDELLLRKSNIDKLNEPSINRSTFPDDERGVHNGEFSVRPNVQDSMVFLRKLFTHQREGGDAVKKLLSPPDGRLLTKGLSRRGFWPHDIQLAPAFNALQESHNKADKEDRKALGVFTLPRVPTANVVSLELQHIKEICLHNAQICKSVDEIEKHEVWCLIAQLVDMRLNETSRTRFDGWGQSGGMSFSVSLIDNLLKYYESLGDIQMLASIVCVLRSKNDSSRGAGKLIPNIREEKYDIYIRRYADLLYGWSLLIVRAEVLKHLSPLPEFHRTRRLPEAFDEDVTFEPTIGLVFLCTRCHRETNLGTNYCHACRDYAFRCSICENAVRGLFSVCKSCGHGGHMNHLQSWFSMMEECPSGCGCKCLSLSASLRSIGTRLGLE
ncbi:hypothetical protein FisN_7Lh049 [Fistulifera solaris]|uniref:WDR59/RTC1-like RING zinc finger domain-containing protein n=1 Tax=Fistulifera solaris TaxID=1519565 RepID=A0A1Z5JD46_FISSO|nr:hypothetical protein FisN_7Lh049 [Fistulifera solaris]|eukprot:GAX11681.1 hypothetical protein FisN_7Lh049 [Fistulifera solaris]